MGGNVFKERSKRLPAKEYEGLEYYILNRLFTLFPHFPVTGIVPIKYYRNKPTFGDMDILINMEYNNSDWKKAVIEDFKLSENEYKSNGGVLSILVHDFQIDLIPCVGMDFQTSQDYFAYNDLGNLIGRITHKLGIKFGHDGSWVVVKEDDRVIGDILVTDKIEQLFELIDLDYKQWASGFDELEDMFKWVSSSKYFNKEIYDLENRNHSNRVRDKKRKNYTLFLEWCDKQTNLPAYPYDDMKGSGGYFVREPFFTDLICAKFPAVKSVYGHIIKRYEITKKFKEKFNGIIVSELTGLENKELGDFMKYCKEIITFNGKEDYFVSQPQEECNKDIISVFEMYNASRE